MRVSGLGTVIDQAAGEISTWHVGARALQAAANSLFDALVAWRSVANHLEFEPETGADASRVWDCLPTILKNSETVTGDPMHWRSDPLAMRAAMQIAARRLVALPAETPRCGCSVTARPQGLLALGRVVDRRADAQPPGAAQRPRRIARLRVPDLLPALINGRAGVPHSRRGGVDLDLDCLARRSHVHRVRDGRNHAVRATGGCRLRDRQGLHDRRRPHCRFRRGGCLRIAAASDELRRLLRGARVGIGAGRGAVVAVLGTKPVRRGLTAIFFRCSPLKPGDLRSATILQYGDCFGQRDCFRHAGDAAAAADAAGDAGTRGCWR